MRKIQVTPNFLLQGLQGMLISAVITIPMWLIGGNVLGNAVVALLYLAPIAWSANRWGQIAGITAALTAALCFDFLFIPPFYTFAVGSLESWLVLFIFFAIAIVVVGRIQDSLSKARETTFMYELSAALANARTQDAVAHTVAQFIRQLFQASRVSVSFQRSKQVPGVMVIEPSNGGINSQPDRILPIFTSWGLSGEIQIWRGGLLDLPSGDSPLLKNFASQAADAFERTLSLELERGLHDPIPMASTNDVKLVPPPKGRGVE